MKYYILGSGGFAREVLFLCKETYGDLENFGGFISPDNETNNLYCLGQCYPIINENQFLEQADNKVSLYIGLGNPKVLAKVTETFKAFQFPNLIHPNVVKGEDLTLGSGNIITAGCTLTVNILMGDFNVLNLHTTIGHDVVIGNCNVINPGANISGSVTVGDVNLIGTNSTILQGIHIGSNSVIGAGSLVTKPVSNNIVVIGVPAKEFRKNE